MHQGSRRGTGLPWPLRAINGSLAMGDRLTRRPSFTPSAEEVMDRARKITGLSDFGGDVTPFVRMQCRSLLLRPKFTPLGRLQRKVDLDLRLRNRLVLQDLPRCYPGLAAEPLERPWFILGMPRTGTTLLHRLLAQDPAHRAPLLWELNASLPPPRSPAQQAARMAQLQRGLRLMDYALPEFRAIHSMHPELPEECLASMANDLFTGLLGDRADRVRSWAARQDRSESYRVHRLLLQMLQRGTVPRRWVLKCPIHLLYLEALLRAYPDAGIIQAHREPSEVLPSGASLFYSIARSRYEEVDARVIGRQVLRDFAWMQAEGMRARDSVGPSSTARFVDVQYTALVADPLGTVRNLYRALGAELSPVAATRMERYLQENRQHRLGRHRYALDDFGLDRAAVDEAFTAYRERFLHN